MKTIRYACVALLACVLTAPAAKASADSPRCADAAHRQFDFFAGNWDAYDSAGKLLGHNRVEKAHGGCVLIEHWSGVEGESGTSLNIYDANRKVWNETWASSHGTLLTIEGGMRGKQMVMIGTHVEDDGRVALHRNIWTPLPDGVHQVWDYSLDGGQTWIVNYDGYLRPAKAGR